MVLELNSESSRSNQTTTDSPFVPPPQPSVTIPNHPTITTLNPSMNLGSPPTIGEKLNGTNYPIWKAQIEPYLDAANLLSVLDGTESPPPQSIPHSSNSSLTEVNPAYKSWRIRDSIAKGWILNSFTSPVVAQLTGHTSSASIWRYLSQAYAAQSSARASSLRLQLQAITKGNRSITKFLQEATTISDQLSAIGEPLSTNEYHTYLFRGLGPDFATLDTAISVLS